MKLAVADLAFPQPCLGCRVLVRGGLCSACAAAAPRVGTVICLRCGAPAPAPMPSCTHCDRLIPSFDEARASLLFEGVVRSAIHRFKYQAERSLLEALLEMVDLGSVRCCEAVTWVPITRQRLLHRGYDHAQMIAQEVAVRLDVPCLPLLRRVKETARQVGLDLDQRRANLADAFTANRPLPHRVIVVDDVFTTGATADACAYALKSGGASKVDIITLARALPKSRMSAL